MTVCFRSILVFVTTGLACLLGGCGGSSAGRQQELAPSAPTNVVVTAGNALVTMAWSASPGATSYNVKRATSGAGPYALVASPIANSHSDTNLKNGTTYFYTVSAANLAGESTSSAQVSAKPTAGSPAPGSTVVSVTVSPSSASTPTSGNLQFTATVQGSTSDKSVTWTASAGTITSSGLYTATASSGSATITATSSADSSKSASADVMIDTTSPPNPTPVPPATSALPPTFFSQTINSVNPHDFPSVGFGSMRLWGTFTTWAEIEISSNNYKWSEVDAWLELAGKEQKDILYTFGVTPQWASMRPSEACSQGNANPGCAAPPADVDSGDAHWKAFVTALVKHSLASSSGHIKYYEIWNEPNDPKCWTGTYAQLATMAKDAYAIIHSLDPNAKVVGPSPTGSNTVQWLASYYAAGARNAQDIVALHSYLTAKTDSPAIATRVDSLRSMMTSNGIGNLPIWSTEGGFGALPLSDSQRVATVGQMYTLLWSKDVGRFYWYAWDSINNWGTMWTASGGVNASGTAYGLLYKWLVGSTHSADPCSEASDGTWTCSLTLSSDYPAEIIWNATTSKTITVSSAFATYETLTSSTVHSIAENKVTIGSEPILLIKSQTVN
jgi:polysaccharide biosynthesis protein PslG